MTLSHLDDASLGAVLKTALDAVVVMRTDGMIAGWNDGAERTFGWSLAETHGRRMSEMIIPERFREAHERGLTHYLATGEGPVLNQHIEIEALHRKGYEFPIELSITRTEQFGEPVFLGFIRDISERRDAARRQELMIGELNHRVKNLLGVVSGIAHMTARSSDTIDAFSAAFGGRLSSLGRAHEILTAATWERAPLRSLAREMLGAYATGPGAAAQVDGPDVLLAPRHLLAVSMILHELLTNAVKYGGLSAPGASVALNWLRSGRELQLEWMESGLSGVQPPIRTGFGSKMIKMTVAHDLRGQATTEWREDGMMFRLAFDLGDEEA